MLELKFRQNRQNCKQWIFVKDQKIMAKNLVRNPFSPERSSLPDGEFEKKKNATGKSWGDASASSTKFMPKLTICFKHPEYKLLRISSFEIVEKKIKKQSHSPAKPSLCSLFKRNLGRFWSSSNKSPLSFNWNIYYLLHCIYIILKHLEKSFLCSQQVHWPLPRRSRDKQRIFLFDALFFKFIVFMCKLSLAIGVDFFVWTFYTSSSAGMSFWQFSM